MISVPRVPSWLEVKAFLTKIFVFVYNLLKKFMNFLGNLSVPVARAVRGKVIQIDWSRILKKGAVHATATATAQSSTLLAIKGRLSEEDMWELVYFPILGAVVLGILDYFGRMAFGTVGDSGVQYHEMLSDCPYKIAPGGLVCTKCMQKYRDHQIDYSQKEYKGLYPNKICNGELVIVS